MIKHIILWKLHDEAHGLSKAENALKAKHLFESLEGKIPGLLKMEVGVDEVGIDQSVDLALYSEFESMEALDSYQHHPEHIKLKPFMMSIRRDRHVIDYHI